MKFRSAWKVIAIVLLGCASLLAIKIIDGIPPHRLASLLGIRVTVSDTNIASEATPTVTHKIAGTSSLGDVAVQTFSGPALIRQGSGTAVSADGLILTTTGVAPYGSGSYTYQIATPRGSVLRARRLTSDPTLGLTLLKVEAQDLSVLLFDQHVELQTGAQLEAIASRFALSRLTSLQLPLWITWADEDRAGLSMDRSYGAQINGARLIDSEGHSVGILRWIGSPVFVNARQINGFLEQYLENTGQ